MSGHESDDDTPRLSAAALAALQEFYQEQNVEVAEQSGGEATMDKMPQENWQLSQFWYDDVTSERLAREALDVAGPNGSIACISCPTLYHKLREMKSEKNKAVILEFDERFKTFGEDFVHYDYNQPLALPHKLRGAFDIVIADPPFLSDECLTKTALTVKFMARDKVILCTGAKMAELAQRLLQLETCPFQPRHSNNLANEFKCYANYSTTHLNTTR